MEAKQGLILVICSMILAGEVACFPNDVRAKSFFSQDDAAALDKYDDIDWELMLKHLPGFLLRVLKKVLKGVAKNKDPIDILIDAISAIEGKPSKGKKKKKNKKEEEEKSNENEKENTGNETEEEKPEGGSGSGNPDTESQEDIN